MAFDPQGRGGAAGNDDLYEVLGLTPDATDDEVDAAYQRLLNGLTSSSATSAAAVENLRRRRIRLANAYAVLADPEGRAAYDERMGLPPVARPATPDITLPDTSIPPMAMPEVTPRTEIPPMAMPEVTPRTAVPPMPMPEIRTPPPVRPQRPAPPPPAEEPFAEVAPDSPTDTAALDMFRPPQDAALETVVTSPLTLTPVGEDTDLAADEAPDDDDRDMDAEDLTDVAGADRMEDAALTASLVDEEEAPPPPVDDTPAPWEPPTRRAPVVPPPPPVKARPAERRPAPLSTPASRPVGGVTLPSRKVAEATPLPAPRSRFVAAPTSTRPLDDEEDEQPVPRPRPAPRTTPAPARQRAPVPVRRTSSRKSSTTMWQKVFYGSMALILAIGTIAGIVTSVGVGTIGSAAPTPIVSSSAALTQADALLAAGNYTQAISLYNQVLTNSNGSDAKALLGLAKSYFYKTPSEPDIAREYLARVFTSTGGSTSSPEATEALSLLSTIGLPSSPGAGTPTVSGTSGGTPGATGTTPPATAGATGTTPVPPTTAGGAAGTTPLPPTAASGTTPLPPTTNSGATGTTPLPPTTNSGATGTTPLPATQPVPATSGAAAPPAGAPAAGTASPNP